MSYFLGLNPGQDEIDEMIEETDRDNSGAIDFRLVAFINYNLKLLIATVFSSKRLSVPTSSLSALSTFVCNHIFRGYMLIDISFRGKTVFSTTVHLSGKTCTF